MYGISKEFFNRFRAGVSVRIRSIEELVEQARKLVAGVGAQDLRDTRTCAQHVHRN